MSYLLEHPGRVAVLALAHLELLAGSVAVALAIAFPLGILASRHAKLQSWLLGTLSAIYTIPSLAILALLVGVLGLGIAPIFVALVAYGQFMLVRGIVTALQGVDPVLRDAARGLGLSSTQSLWRVELPLALPVAIGGLRVATIAMNAIATLGAYVGGRGLGVLIFNGLTLHNNSMILAGSISASVLVIVIDTILRLVERRVRAKIS